MSDRIVNSCRSFRREEKGAIIVLFALLIVPFLFATGAAIDYGRMLLVKRQLTSAVDAAALAVARSTDFDDQDALKAQAQSYIEANYPAIPGESLANLSITKASYLDGSEEIGVTLSVDVPAPFMKIGGIDHLTVAVTSKVLRRENELEVVMVLDNSGSMSSSGKLQDMKDAAKTLVDLLMGLEEETEKVRIALVPFTAAVNLDVADNTPWLDRSNPASLNHQYLDLAPGESAFDVLDVMAGGAPARWGGCVRSRANPFDITDAPPDTLNRETLFSAYFNPFKNDGSYKSKKADYIDISSNEQNKNCPASPIQPLINRKSDIDSAIDSMTANGNTNIAEALAWGWRVLSPAPPFTEGAPYSSETAIKVIILLTDGENAVSGSTTFSSYGFGGGNNPQLGPSVDYTLDLKTNQVCTNIKEDKDGDSSDEDILIYTIAFDVSGPLLSLMRDCATNPDLFFDTPSAFELRAAFQKIASSLNQLRVLQ
jgi:Flp pilus assembly protein TadG